MAEYTSMFCTVVNETRWPWTVEEDRIERRKESATCSYNFYLHIAKILHTVTTAKAALTGALLQNA